MRIVGRLKGRQVATIKPPKERRSVVVADGGNLFLQATIGRAGNIRRSWVFRYELGGQRHEIGLGPLHTVSLQTARAKARDLRQQLLDHVDPLTERRKERQRAYISSIVRSPRSTPSCSSAFLTIVVRLDAPACGGFLPKSPAMTA